MIVGIIQFEELKEHSLVLWLEFYIEINLDWKNLWVFEGLEGLNYRLLGLMVLSELVVCLCDWTVVCWYGFIFVDLLRLRLLRNTLVMLLTSSPLCPRLYFCFLIF